MCHANSTTCCRQALAPPPPDLRGARVALANALQKRFPSISSSRLAGSNLSARWATWTSCVARTDPWQWVSKAIPASWVGDLSDAVHGAYRRCDNDRGDRGHPQYQWFVCEPVLTRCFLALRGVAALPGFTTWTVRTKSCHCGLDVCGIGVSDLQALGTRRCVSVPGWLRSTNCDTVCRTLSYHMLLLNIRKWSRVAGVWGWRYRFYLWSAVKQRVWWRTRGWPGLLSVGLVFRLYITKLTCCAVYTRFRKPFVARHTWHTLYLLGGGNVQLLLTLLL